MDQSSYSFASDPRAVAPKRSAYRPDASAVTAELSQTSSGHAPNIMQDPRVWRGSTYAGPAAGHKHASLPMQDATQSLIGTGRRTKRGGTTKRRGHGASGIYDLRPAARRHVEVSLEEHLIEQVEAAPEVEVTTQTDVFEDRPQTPDYVPKKTGIDVSTQIEPDGLFNFDTEVEPILDIIVGKTLEQALLEVEEETELDAIEGRKKQLLESKRQDGDRINKMEAQAIEEYKKMALLRKRAQGAAAAQDQARRKVGAVHAGHVLSQTAVQAAMGALYRAGGFSNPDQEEVEANFIPWLLERVNARVAAVDVANKCRDEAIRCAVRRGAQLVAAEKARLAAEEAARQAALAEERRTYVRVFVKVMVGEGDDAVERMAGPIRVKRAFTVAQVEAAIQAWLRDNPVGDGFEVPTGLNLMYGGSSLERERSLLDQALPDDAQLEIGGAEPADDDV